MGVLKEMMTGLTRSGAGGSSSSRILLLLSPFGFLLVITLFSGLTQSAPGSGYYYGGMSAFGSGGGSSSSASNIRNGSRNLPTNLNEGGHKERHTKETLVETSSGKLRGLRRSVVGKEVYVYFGIPFARPPLGDLRFKKPVEARPWEGVYSATNLPNSCYQERYESFPGFRGEDQWNPTTNISEDCLYMNLWTPKSAIRKPERKLPILVWIYGGGYMSGTISLDIYNADVLAAENDVIVVTVNYRVGAFGFLFMDTEDAPGNQGMYDQVMALEWIRKNAHVFGGDPDAVTMFGESAGGGSVTFHLLSPISRHLIKRGIIQSGTLNAPWSVMEADEARQMAKELLAEVGCNGTRSNSAAVKCLRDIPARNISIQQWNSYKSILAFPSRPTIDGVFLPRHPMDMLKEGDFKKTELLLGSNKNEGTYFILYDFMSYFDKDAAQCLARDKFLEIIDAIFPDRSPLEKEAIVFQYTHWEDLQDECKNADMVMDLVGDYFFICPSNAFAQAYSDQGGKVYYYYFTHRTKSNPWGEWMGVLHGDEIEYVFGHPLNASGPHTVAEQNLSRKVMGYFSRFARTGKPVEDETLWPLYTRNDPTYFILNTEDARRGRGPRSHTCAFWNEFMPLVKPGTNSLPSKCGKERWDINSIQTASSSEKTNSVPPSLAQLVTVSVALVLVGTLQSLVNPSCLYFTKSTTTTSTG